MDSEQRTIASQQQNPELCARVIRTIADIERDSHFAWGALSERLMREVGSAFRVASPEAWIVEADESRITVVSPDWKANRGVNQRDAVFDLIDMAESEQEFSWAAVIAGVPPTKLVLELKFRPGLMPIVQMLKDKEPTVVAMLKAGFQKDPPTNRFYMPIVIQAEALALGFEQNDLGDAMLPVREVVGLAISAKPELDALIEHVRNEAKRK